MTVSTLATNELADLNSCTLKLLHNPPSRLTGYSSKAVTYPPPLRKTAVCSLDQLLYDNRELIFKIQDAVGYSDSVFESLVMPSVLTFADFVYLLPASENAHHRGPGGAFTHALEVAHFSAIASHGVAIAQADPPSVRREKEPMWRLATMLAGLIHDAGKPIADLRVSDDNGNFWDPFVCGLYTWVRERKLERYTVQWTTGRHNRHHFYTYRTLNRLLPDTLVSRLNEVDPRIIPAVHDSFVPYISLNTISRIVEACDRRSVFNDYRKDPMQSSDDPSRTGLRISRLFFKQLSEHYELNKKNVNEVGSHIFHTVEGTFLLWHPLVQKIFDEVRKQFSDDISVDPDELAHEICLTNGIVPAEEVGDQDLIDRRYELYWYITPKPFQERDGASQTKLRAVKLANPEMVFSELPKPVECIVHNRKKDAPTMLHVPMLNMYFGQLGLLLVRRPDLLNQAGGCVFHTDKGTFVDWDPAFKLLKPELEKLLDLPFVKTPAKLLLEAFNAGLVQPVVRPTDEALVSQRLPLLWHVHVANEQPRALIKMIKVPAGVIPETVTLLPVKIGDSISDADIVCDGTQDLTTSAGAAPTGHSAEQSNENSEPGKETSEAATTVQAKDPSSTPVIDTAIESNEVAKSKQPAASSEVTHHSPKPKPVNVAQDPALKPQPTVPVTATDTGSLKAGEGAQESSALNSKLQTESPVETSSPQKNAPEKVKELGKQGSFPLYQIVAATKQDTAKDKEIKLNKHKEDALKSLKDLQQAVITKGRPGQFILNLVYMVLFTDEIIGARWYHHHDLSKSNVLVRYPRGFVNGYSEPLDIVRDLKDSGFLDVLGQQNRPDRFIRELSGEQVVYLSSDISALIKAVLDAFDPFINPDNHYPLQHLLEMRPSSFDGPLPAAVSDTPFATDHTTQGGSYPPSQAWLEIAQNIRQSGQPYLKSEINRRDSNQVATAILYSVLTQSSDWGVPATFDIHQQARIPSKKMNEAFDQTLDNPVFVRNSFTNLARQHKLLITTQDDETIIVLEDENSADTV